MIHDASDHGVSKEPMNPLQTALEKFENIALFLQLGLPSTLIRHENGTFPTSKRRNLKTPALSFSADRKPFENGSFRERWRHDKQMMSPARVFVERKSIMTGDCCLSKFLQHTVD